MYIRERRSLRLQVPALATGSCTPSSSVALSEPISNVRVVGVSNLELLSVATLLTLNQNNKIQDNPIPDLSHQRNILFNELPNPETKYRSIAIEIFKRNVDLRQQMTNIPLPLFQTLTSEVPIQDNKRICCPESNMSFPTVASSKSQHITPVSPRKQSDRENRRRTSPGNDVTAPAVSFYRPRNQINRENLRRASPGNSVTEKITDGPPRKQQNCSSISITEDHTAGELRLNAPEAG